MDAVSTALRIRVAFQSVQFVGHSDEQRGRRAFESQTRNLARLHFTIGVIFALEVLSGDN